MDNVKVKKEKINKKTLGIIIGIVLGVITVISISYAYWNITYNQEDSNVVTTDCFLIDFEEENDISLLETNPIIDEEVSSLTPYTFTIRNTCTMNATYQVNVEVTEGTTLDHNYIRTELNNTKSNLVEYGEVEPTIANATNSYKMYESILASGSEMTFNLKEWIKEVDPSDSEWMSKIFKSKVTITFSPYLEELPNTEYAYTGDVQEFTVPVTGYYNVELWGAGGSTYIEVRVQGGYTKGTIYLEKDDVLYLYIGAGNTKGLGGWNGGGANGLSGGYSGNGATDIRTVYGTWNDSTSLRSRIMVAGGAGGRGCISSGCVTADSNAIYGGYGGGLFGGRGSYNTTMGLTSPTTLATQTSGYQFGIGGSGGYYSNTGGGGGYYGGVAGIGNTGPAAGWTGGGGGSSYISGYAGVNSVEETGGTVAQPLHTNNTLHYSGKYFIKGHMEAGINGSNGKAKISYVGEPQRTNTNLDNVRYIKSCLNGSSANTSNHWIELQAIKDGVNVAKGKTPLSTSSLGNPAMITDGVINYDPYASQTTGVKCVTIDLGAIYNLDEIGLWLYWGDGRRYNDNILSVGETNTSGTTSLSTILHNYSGTTGYAETSQGRRYTAWD